MAIISVDVPESMAHNFKPFSVVPLRKFEQVLEEDES